MNKKQKSKKLVDFIDHTEELLNKIQQSHDDLVVSSHILGDQKMKLLLKNMNKDQIWEQIRINLDPINHKNDIYLEKVGQKIEQQEQSQKLKKKKGSSQAKQELDEEDSEIEEEEENFENEEESVASEEVIQKKSAGKKEPKKQTFKEEMADMEKFLDQADEEDRAFQEKLKSKGKKGGDNKKNLDEEEGIEDEEEDDISDLYNQDMDEEGDDDDDDDEEEGGFGNDNGDFGGKDDYEDDDDDDRPAKEDESMKDEGENEDLDADEQVYFQQREFATQQKEEDEMDREDREFMNRENDEIEHLEKKLLNKNDADWRLRGEVFGKHRPVDSLQEEILDFKKNNRISDISAEFQKSIEQVIKQRILDDQFDDRKKQIVQHFFRNKEDFTVSQEKSSVGLGQLYEQEFRKQLNLDSKDVKQDKQKLEAFNLLQEIFYKLDQLTDFKFVPKHTINQQLASEPIKVQEEQIPLKIRDPGQELNKLEQRALDRGLELQTKVEQSTNEKKAARLQKKKIQKKIKQRVDAKKKMYGDPSLTKYEAKKISENKKTNKKIELQKQVKSVKFTKSSEFFKNINDAQNQPQSQDKSKKNNTYKHKSFHI